MTEFNPDISRVAIIAGNGHLPGEIHREMLARNQKPLLVGIAGEIDEALAQQAFVILSYGQLSKLFLLLKNENIHHAIFAGGITKRPDFTKLKLDVNTLKEVPILEYKPAVITKGATNLFLPDRPTRVLK